MTDISPLPEQAKGDVLIVDDTLPNLRLLSDVLCKQGYAVRGASSGAAALMMSRAEPSDLILLDIRMPEMDGYQVCQQLKADVRLRDIPVIFISALDDVEAIIRGFEFGGVDYITKPFHAQEVLARIQAHVSLRNLQKRLEVQNARLQHEVARRKQAEDALQLANDTLEQQVAQRTAALVQANRDLQKEITEHRRADEERARLLAQVQRQAQQIQEIIDAVPEGILVLDAEGKIVLVNPAARGGLAALSGMCLGDTLTSLNGRPLSDLLVQPDGELWHEIEEGQCAYEVLARPVSIIPNCTGWVLVIRDMTHEQEMQERLRHQDRLAVIGQLAGGVAHDFNNLLTAIQGYTALLLDDVDASGPLHADLEQIGKAADRAAALTRQLLAFSRKQVLQPRVLDLNDLIQDIEKMLHRLIGEDIELVTILASDLARINADPGQVEQVIVNLVVNARDAMPEGGRLTIETANVWLDDVYVRERADVQPGPYVTLTVSDTGAGMAEEVLSHLFEPFFTTKEPGKGTGLGLATVHGIVQQSGGHIEVDSEPGEGTTFQVSFPQAEGAEPSGRARIPAASSHGSEVILLVEDDEMVQDLARRILEQQGYTVLAASHPDEALLSGTQHAGPIHLLIADVVMPGMNGRSLAEQVTALHPETKVLYISGYTADAIECHGVLQPGIVLLEKPFTPETLAHKVRKVLDGLSAAA